MKTELVEKLARNANKVGFKVKKYSPEILLVTGIVGIITSTVLACKATTKVGEIVEEHKETVEKIHDGVENHRHTSDGEEYTKEIATQDLKITYIQTAVKFAKLYAVPASLGVASICCMVGANQIMRKRNAALATALATVNTSFAKYRERVAARYGKEIERKIRMGIEEKEVTEVVVDEDGNETVVTKTVETVNPAEAHDLYSVIWYEGNKGYTKSPELNKAYLLGTLRELNWLLKRRGVILLNDVYEMLGVPKTSYGCFAGWVWTPDSSIGDNEISFGIFDDPANIQKAAFIQGQERGIVLDFNCIPNAFQYFDKFGHEYAYATE